MNLGVTEMLYFSTFKEQSNYYKTSYKEMLPNINDL
jgi:hypothetical protein